jgi:ABC-type thiamine transport system ATPase subunit/sugar lactone lactonase YvrE
MIAPLWTLDAAALLGPSRPRLEAASIAILPGRTAIVGESGSGKTSLLNLLVGFERPDRGRVEFVSRDRNDERARLPVYWSPAEGGLWPHLSKAEHLTSVAPAEGNAEQIARQLLERFDLLATGSERVDQLSAGERSRLSVARALAANAAVLVLDEPLVHVEPARLRSYWSVIREWCDERGTSLVFSSHQPEIVLAHAERAVCLFDGRIVWSGEVADLYESPPNERAGWSLGPLNWFEPSDAAIWLNRTAALPFGLRPERLAIEETDAPDSPTIGDVIYTGTTRQVSLKHPSGAQRVFHLSAAPRRLTVGARGLLRVLSLCMLALWLPGCFGNADADPSIEVGQVDIWNIPNEGAKVPAPRGLHVAPGGDLMVLDDAGRMLVYDPAHELRQKVWMPEYSVGRPEGLWQMLDGRIAVADTHYHRVLLLRADGTVDAMFGEEGFGPGQFIFPETVVQDPAGALYVCEYGGNDRIQKFSPDGKFITQFGSCGTEVGQFQRPTGLVWFDHKVYVCDAVNNRVQAFTEDGTFEGVVADAQTAGLYYPYDMAVSPAGDLYVVEFGSGRVTKLSREGKLLGRYGSQGQQIGEFSTPWGIAVGQQGQIYVADTGNRRLVELRL